jgi:amino acid transporter
MSTVAKIASSFGAVTLGAAAVLYAPNFMWQFMYNMQGPITIFTFATCIVCFCVYLACSKSLEKESRPAQKEILEWRLWTAVNLAVVVAITWLIVQAIPSPTFNKQIQYVNRVVEKRVPVVKYVSTKLAYKAPTYIEAYDKCRKAFGNYVNLSYEGEKQCHSEALLAAMPEDRKLVITKTLLLRNMSPEKFQAIFKDCVESHNIQIGDGNNQQTIENRNKRMEVCKTVAQAATGQ